MNVKNILKNAVEWNRKYINIYALMIVISVVAIIFTYMLDPFVSLSKIRILSHDLLYFLICAGALFFLGKTLFIDKKIDLMTGSLIATCAVALVAIIVSVLIHKGAAALSPAMLKQYVFFISAPVSFYVFLKINITKKTMKILLIILLIPAVFLILGCIFNVAEYLWWTNYVEYFSGGFYNPNLTALVLLSLFLASLIYLLTLQKIWSKAIVSLFSIGIFVALFATRARISTLLGVFFVVLLFLFMFAEIKVHKWYLIVITLLPFLFALIYLFIMEYTSLDSVIYGLKSFGTRVKIWISAFEYIATDPLFGNYGVLRNEHMHNTLLDVFAKYGALTFGCFCVFMYSVFKEFLLKCDSKIKLVVFGAFVSMYLTGLVEAWFLIGTTGLFVLVSVFLLIANGCNDVKLPYERPKSNKEVL